MFDGTFYTASLNGVEARIAAVMRSCLGSGGGNDQGKQWLKQQLECGRVYFLPFAEVLMSPLDMSIMRICPWPEPGLFTC